MDKTCKACGKSAPQAARYCPGCGHSVETEEQRTARRRKARRTAFIVIGVLAVVLGLGIWLVYRTISDLTGVVRVPVETYLEHLKAGRRAQAYEMTSGTFRQVISESGYGTYLQDRPFLANSASHSFGSYSWKEGIARVSGTLTSGAGIVTPVEFQLLKENGVWRIKSADRR